MKSNDESALGLEMGDHQELAHVQNDDDPLTLRDACDLIFRGAISPATLRAEARRGRLVIERIGRRDFVTRAGIKAMRKLCEVQPTPAKSPSDYWPEETRATAARLACEATARALIASSKKKK
ncbi:hypothetical protein [Devosia limi]|uniref:hypothetical protein n=1 Tax=Devosia limi TaxID=288995 RepID=UPI00116019B4|nr:hypothetical protein [Devosia limi]